ncbi:DUF488 domain-containing protein [Cytophagaceae bacterium ABcell3]|nr:DUF488 domain-containing protein [Cytophagaceae bacterium ABcell3]
MPIVNDILSGEELQPVMSIKPKSNKTILFTIGYQGISLEEYLNKLLKNDIKLLVDVRRNPKSMKYGFTQSQLKNVCEGVGIKYCTLLKLG